MTTRSRIRLVASLLPLTFGALAAIACSGDEGGDIAPANDDAAAAITSDGSAGDSEVADGALSNVDAASGEDAASSDATNDVSDATVDADAASAIDAQSNDGGADAADTGTDAGACAPGNAYTTADCVAKPISLPSYDRLDFDVSFDGALTYAGRDGNDLYVGCLNPDGTTRRAAFLVGSDDMLYSLRIRRARTSGTSVVAWQRINLDWPTVGTKFYVRYAVLDAQCNVIAGPAKMESDPLRVDKSTTARSDYPMLDVGDDGSFVGALASGNEWRLVARNADGSPKHASTYAPPTGCIGLEYSEITVHPTTGEVAHSCSSTETSATRYVRRFNADLTAQTPWVTIPEKASTFDAGRFGFLRGSSDAVYIATAATPQTHVLYQFSSAGVLSNVVTLGPDALGIAARPLWDSNGVLILSMGAQLRIASGPVVTQTIARSGNLRIDGQNRVYTLASGKVTRSGTL